MKDTQRAVQLKLEEGEEKNSNLTLSALRDEMFKWTFSDWLTYQNTNWRLCLSTTTIRTSREKNVHINVNSVMRIMYTLRACFAHWKRHSILWSKWIEILHRLFQIILKKEVNIPKFYCGNEKYNQYSGRSPTRSTYKYPVNNESNHATRSKN